MINETLELERQGKPSEAIEYLSRSIDAARNTSAPLPRGAYPLLSRLLIRIGHFADAEKSIRVGLQQNSKDFDLLNMLGIALRRLGRADEALKALDQAQRLNPKHLAPLVNKGNIYLDLRQSDKSIATFSQLIRLNPKNAEFHRLLGVSYILAGDLARALPKLDAACRLAPNDVANWIDRAKADTDYERHAEALAIVERGLQHLPDNQRLFEARIMILRRSGRFPEAEAHLLKRIETDPNDSWAHFQLAETVGRFDRPRGNIHYQKAVELSPSNQNYWINLANSLDRTRQGDEAAHIQAAYEAVLKAMSLGPLPSRQLRMARNILVRIGRFDLVSQLGTFRDLGRGWANESLHDALHYHLARVETPEDRYEILEQHRIWGRIEEAKAKLNPVTAPAIHEKREKIRLGFMSSDLRNHPVSYFAMPLFDDVDRSKFELYCYSYSRNQPDQVQQYLATRVDAFRWNKAIGDRDAAQLIANDNLDMLFELGSSTDMNKLEVMAYKAAPVQASWLGYPNSAGLETIDYILVDPYINPDDPKLLVEKPFLMPDSWVAMGRLGFNEAEIIAPGTPEERNGFITFGTANNPYKYGPSVLKTWAQTVKSVDGSKFRFVRPESGVPAFRDAMAKAFAAEGVSADRLIFTAVRGTHMRWYNEMDISLDTFPQTGGTTTCESLFMGVPVITLVGPAFFERLSYSNLSNAGLPDLCAFSLDEYRQKAIALAADAPRRRALRHSLRQDIKQKPLGQPKKFAEDFYALVKQIVTERK